MSNDPGQQSEKGNIPARLPSPIDGSDQRRTKSPQDLTIETIREEFQFTGPIPPPQYLEAYEKCAPGTANRILALTEKAIAHQNEIENKLIDAQIAIEAATEENERQSVLRGQYCALLVCFMSLGAAIVCVYLQSNWVAGLIGGTGLGTLVVAFLANRKSEAKEAAKESKAVGKPSTR